jgi:guanylate kinase
MKVLLLGEGRLSAAAGAFIHGSQGPPFLCASWLRFLRHSISRSMHFSSSSSSQEQQREHHHHHHIQRTINTSNSVGRPQPRPAVLDPLVVCGPSGVGKGTIIDRFMQEQQQQQSNKTFEFAFTVSHTTRPPRHREVDGVHYKFVASATEMQQLIDANAFLEYATVHGNIYGTSWSSIEAVHNATAATNATNATEDHPPHRRSRRRIALLDIDVQGVQRLKQMSDNNTNSNYKLRPRYIFIAPPSLEVLRQRLIDRGTESAESLIRRTSNAAKELEYGLQDGVFDEIVINDDLEQAVLDFSAAVGRLYME